MVITERHRIILKSKTAGNSEDRPQNFVIISEYIALPNLFAVSIFQPCVLADGGGIDFPYAGARCNEMPYLAFAKALIVEPCYPAISRASLCIVVEALAPEFNFSHSLQFFCNYFEILPESRYFLK